jgi:16S rRNA (guanine527-N7)-methyltransferase
VSLDERIRRVVTAFADVDASRIDAASAWLGDVSCWNRKLDLTAARNDDELVDLMLADAAVLAAHLASDRSVVDVGSGAGAPGMPLALLRPDLQLTLVEPMQKRAALLRMTVGKQRLSNLRVEQRHGDELSGPFDVAISRATLPPPRWLALGARLAPDGEVWVLLAREPCPELQGWERVEEHAYRWPLTGAERRLACYRPQASSVAAT